jgi:hypothetical protein
MPAKNLVFDEQRAQIAYNHAWLPVYQAVALVRMIRLAPRASAAA